MIKVKDFFTNFKKNIKKDGSFLSGIGSIFTYSAKRKIDDAMLQDIKRCLLESDVGSKATKKIINQISKKKCKAEEFGIDAFKSLLSEIIQEIVSNNGFNLNINNDNDLTVFVVCGVNGNGKTTTIAKIANLYIQNKKKVVLGACDTFRAAAKDQLLLWSEKLGIECIYGDKIDSDPASVAYKALEYAIKEDADLLIIDTAGRVHNQDNLMSELQKIIKVINKKTGKEIDEIIMCIDATTGQNAISQLSAFNDRIGVSSVIITKMDGSAKAGTIIALSDTFKSINIAYLGVGENIGDLQKFDPVKFSKDILDIAD
ncbi:signal recognition particle-docking protein FtsY [Anaplasmataceae bacterium AB001_6]|nr:signal recognition particle-docking protein FtsY [Anaplasmataceae bacterium AB001_6]